MPMILTDPRQEDNPIVFANKAFLDLTGYEETEVLGRNCRFLQGPQTDRTTVVEMRESVAAREAISAEILNYKRDGSPFWNAVFIGPVYDVDGELRRATMWSSKSPTPAKACPLTSHNVRQNHSSPPRALARAPA